LALRLTQQPPTRARARMTDDGWRMADGRYKIVRGTPDVDLDTIGTTTVAGMVVEVCLTVHQR
jgi:hypothetical protein